MRLKKKLARGFISYQQNCLMRTCLRKQATKKKKTIKVIIFLGFLLSKVAIE